MYNSYFKDQCITVILKLVELENLLKVYLPISISKINALL